MCSLALDHIHYKRLTGSFILIAPLPRATFPPTPRRPLMPDTRSVPAPHLPTVSTPRSPSTCPHRQSFAPFTASYPDSISQLSSTSPRSHGNTYVHCQHPAGRLSPGRELGFVLLATNLS